jgi:hypothetical protein
VITHRWGPASSIQLSSGQVRETRAASSRRSCVSSSYSPGGIIGQSIERVAIVYRSIPARVLANIVPAP